MKRVGVRDFRDHATQYLGGEDVIAVERHGEPIGFYIPTGKGRRISFEEALGRLEQSVNRVLAETGMTEDELAHLFDLNQPLSEPSHEETSARPHASRR